MSSSWFHINRIIVPFSCLALSLALPSTHIFPFARCVCTHHSFSFIFFACRILYSIFLHTSLPYLLHFVTSFGCMITSNLVSNLKCKFSMVIYTASTRLVQRHAHRGRRSYCAAVERVSKSTYCMCVKKERCYVCDVRKLVSFKRCTKWWFSVEWNGRRVRERENHK